MKTFEEWYAQADTFNGRYDAAEAAWQACAAEHQEEHKLVANLRALVDASEREIASLESRLDEVRKLGEKWRTTKWVADTIPLPEDKPRHKLCADELLAILDRKAGS